MWFGGAKREFAVISSPMCLTGKERILGCRRKFLGRVDEIG